MGCFRWYFYLKVGICIMLLYRMNMRPRHVMDFKLLKHQRKMLSVNQQQRPRWTSSSNNLKKGFLLSVEQIPILEQNHNLLIFIFFSSIFFHTIINTQQTTQIIFQSNYLFFYTKYNMKKIISFVFLIKVFFFNMKNKLSMVITS